MDKEKNIGFAVKMLSNLIKREVGKSLLEVWQDEATVNHLHIICYLYCNRERNVYQRELETHYNIRRSTVTQTLQLMEKNGIVERIPAENDARQKRLMLTARGMEMHEQGRKCMENFEESLREGISDEELAQFFETTEKLIANLKRMSEQQGN